ncbi:MAG: lipopolysaccharide biosynthesis protein [Ignavibacteriae bacterium]|nr:lipopolysaccharide biosynthesis protein [Ignavibacteriota bacterium]
MQKSLTDRTLTGINWNVLKIYGKAGINIIVGVILARLLPPSDFGLVGMTVIFTGLADLFSTLGMGSSVIKLKFLSDTHIYIATLTTTLLGIIIFFIFYLLSPIIANFYNEPRLLSILRILSLVFILKGMSTVSYSLIMREMDFKSILKIELVSFIFGYSLITIVLALSGFGVWSLVIGRIASVVVSNIQTQIRKPIQLKLVFSKKEFNELFAFGSGVSISKLLNYIASNIDYLIIGKFLNSFQLGLYQRSYNLMTLPISQMSGSIYSVLFPAFSAVQDDVQKLRTAYLRTIKTVVFILYPLLTMFYIGGEYIILGLYGQKWHGAINAFKILTLSGFFSSTLSYSGAIAHATGKVFNEVFQQFVYVTVLSIGVFYGIKYNIEGAAIAVVVALIILFILQSQLAIKIAKIPFKEFLLSFFPGIFVSAVVFASNNLLIYLFDSTMRELPYPIKLILLVGVTLTTIIICILFMPKSIKGDVVDWLISKYNNKIPRQFKDLYYKYN